ncbi:MAG: PKD domain-containing protein, partial [Methanoregulaceae archaeon]|nr:PKD domain-containing protein [Methanoregulaceae archaeon]
MIAACILALVLVIPVTGENVTASATDAAPAATSSQVTAQATTVQTTTAVPATTTVSVKKTPPGKKPLIGFSAVPREGPAPLTVTFYPVFNASGGAPAYMIWDFGDGQKANVTLGTSYEHTYLAAGTYSVSLTSVNEAGTSLASQPSYISVKIPPAPATTAATQTTVTQAATTATTTNVTTTVPTTTPTTVMTLASSSSIQSAAPTEEFGPVPCVYSNSTSADFYALPTAGYAPLRVSFFDNSSCIPPTMWDWDFGTSVRPGLTTMQNPIITFTDPGNYTVTLVVVNAFSNNSTR